MQNDSSGPKLKRKIEILENKEVCIVEMLYKSNVIVLVYADQRNKIVIWDDHEKRNRTEITFQPTQLIIGVKLRKDMIVLIFHDKTFIFDFATLKLIE